MQLGAKLVKGRLTVDSNRFNIASEGRTNHYQGIITNFRVTNLGLQINGHTEDTPYRQEHYIILVRSGNIYVDRL